MPLNDPVPSTAADVLKYNVERFDEVVTSGAPTYTDRLGKERLTVAGFEADASAQLAQIQQNADLVLQSTGWFPVEGSFQTGGTITAKNQVLFDEDTKTNYSWGGALPKVVPPGSTVASAGGVGVDKWTDRGDGALRTTLSQDYGSANIKNNVVAVDGLKGLADIPPGLRRSDLRYESDGFYVGSTVGGGTWKWKADEPKSNHNGGTVVDPDRVVAWDGTQGDLATLFTAAVSGVGCFVLISERVSLYNYGYIPQENNSIAITQAVNTAFTGKKCLYTSSLDLEPFEEQEMLGLSKPEGQIAAGTREILAYGNTIITLCKGSYTLNDRSFLTTLKYEDGALIEIDRIDFGVGSDVRSMAILNGFLYVFAPAVSGIRVYSLTEGAKPVFKFSLTTVGFPGLQFSYVIDNHICLFGWSSYAIRVLEQSPDGSLKVIQEIVTTTRYNAEAVPLGDGSHVIFKHNPVGDEVIGRFWFDQGRIKDLNFYSLDGVGFLRRGVSYKNAIFTTSYADIGKDMIKIKFNETTGEPFIEKEFSGERLGANNNSFLGRFLVSGNRVFDMELETGFDFLKDSSFDEVRQGYLQDGVGYFLSSTGEKSPDASSNDDAQDAVVTRIEWKGITPYRNSINQSYKESAITVSGFTVIKSENGEMFAYKAVEMGSAQDITVPAVVSENISSLGFVSAPVVTASLSISSSTASEGNTSFITNVGFVSATSVGIFINRINTSFVSDTSARLHLILCGKWK